MTIGSWVRRERMRVEKDFEDLFELLNKEDLITAKRIANREHDQTDVELFEAAWKRQERTKG